jgi:hypothetical protein
MAEELGKIQKPEIKEFKGGRKLFYVPLVLSGPNLPQEFNEKYQRYWEQVESQISSLEAKLGKANQLFHELIPKEGAEGLKTLQQLNIGSLAIIKSRIEQGAALAALEDNEIMTQLMDWSRCLSIGLQSQKVFSVIYELYTEANNKRNELIAKNINNTLQENESGIIIMAEGHRVQFPPDIQIFYVAPPALDDIKRWMRDYEAKTGEKHPEDSQPQEKTPENPLEG